MATPLPQLTRNAILYLSLGFKQNYTLQVLTARRGERNELQLVLYDGVTYIGALFLNQQKRQRCIQVDLSRAGSDAVQDRRNSKPQEFDIVSILPLTLTRNEPILIEQLTVLTTNLTSLLGTEIITLQEFMRRRLFTYNFAKIEVEASEEREESHSRKIIKMMDEESINKSTQQHSSHKATENHNNQINLLHLLAEERGSQIQQLSRRMQREEQRNQREEWINEREPNERESQKMIIQPQSIPNSHEAGILGQSQDGQGVQKEECKDIIEFEIEQRDNVGLPQIQTQKAGGYIQQKISIILEISEDEQFTLNKNAVINIDSDYSPVSLNPPKKAKAKDELVSMHISDLYERIQRFRILCRVNHISQFTSQRGTFCTKLLLIDEVGDEIVCMIYQKMQERAVQGKQKIVKGRSYIFQNGEVTRDDNGLTFSVSLKGVIDQHRFLPSFIPSKMQRLTQVEREANFFIEKKINLQKQKQASKKIEQTNVCGIFKGFKDEPKLVKNLFRVSGILCDPDNEISIAFVLLVDELTSFPEEGSVVSLHNVVVVEDEQTLHLENTSKSYILSESGNTHDYFADLLKSSALKNWRLKDYRNLSEITYISRTFSELKVLLSRMLQHQFAYSQIDCNIISINEKRFYNSCITCKRQTKPETGLFTYCYNCRHLVKYTKRYLFDLQVSDCTGSIVCLMSSDELEQFINISGEDYGKHEKADRLCYLELCSYQHIIMKVKSERVLGGVNHKAVSGRKFSQQRGLAQIRSIVIDEKTKYVNSW